MNFREDNNSRLNVSKEDNLLVYLSRTELTQGVLKEVLRIANSRVDWDQFLCKAKRHELVGLIHYHYNVHGLPLPNGVSQTLAAEFRRQKATANILLDEIREISMAISGIGLPTVILKGPSIGHRVFPNASIRAFGDIDLLVHMNDVRAVEKCLYKQGYAHIIYNLLQNEIRQLTSDEVQEYRPGLLHRPMLMKHPHSQQEPTVEIHPSNWKIGNVDFGAMFESSVAFPSLGEGTRVLSLDDLVIHSAYHFYRHFRLAMLTDVSTSFGCFLPRNPGVLKYLADIYACLRSYFLADGNWTDLLSRSSEIRAKDILLYGVYYLELVYGNSTVPRWILDELKSPPIQVPLIDTCVEADSVEDLLSPNVQTLGQKIEPEFWLFQSDKTWKRVVEAAKQWRTQNGAWANGSAARIRQPYPSKGIPDNRQWERTPHLVLDPSAPDPRRFFRSLATGGVWSPKNGLKARAGMLWDHRNLYVRINVEAKSIAYVSEEMKEYGESVVLYFSNTYRGSSRIMRVRYAICDGDCVYPIPLPLFSSGACDDIDTSELSAICCSSEREYCVTLRIPWNCISVSVDVDRSIGFDLEVIHRSDNMVLETVLAWSGGYMLSEVDPTVHGDLTLVE